MFICVPLRWFRVSIQQRWRYQWCSILQCGSWSTLLLSGETATPPGWPSNSSYNITAQMVRNSLRNYYNQFVSLCFSWKKILIDQLQRDINMLWYPTDVVSWLEVERLVHRSVFESMPLTRLDSKGVLLRPPGQLGTLRPAQEQMTTSIPWDNPLSYSKQQINTLRTKGNSITVMWFYLTTVFKTLKHAISHSKL